MDLQSIFHTEWVRLANALNALMNEIITNEQSLKWGAVRGESQQMLQKKSFVKGLRDDLIWLISETGGIQLQTKSMMWDELPCSWELMRNCLLVWCRCGLLTNKQNDEKRRVGMGWIMGDQ